VTDGNLLLVLGGGNALTINGIADAGDIHDVIVFI